MRWQRKNTDNIVNNFIEDIENVMYENGVDNAVCVVLDEYNKLHVISLNDDNSVQISGILDLGKSVVHSNIFENGD